MTTVAAILKHKGYQVSTVDPTAFVADVTQLLAERRIGAVLVMHRCRVVAAFFDYAEVVELHHEAKVDAPSGTAYATVREMLRARGDRPFTLPETTKITLRGSRGGNEGGVTGHGVRLQGLVAHQGVIFGALGQTLTLRHDTTSRESFLPGVLLAIRHLSVLTPDARPATLPYAALLGANVGSKLTPLGSLAANVSFVEADALRGLPFDRVQRHGPRTRRIVRTQGRLRSELRVFAGAQGVIGDVVGRVTRQMAHRSGQVRQFGGEPERLALRKSHAGVFRIREQ